MQTQRVTGIIFNNRLNIKDMATLPWVATATYTEVGLSEHSPASPQRSG